MIQDNRNLKFEINSLKNQLSDKNSMVSTMEDLE
jgi:hypothetical protein